jgi:hypothetical protein
MRNGRRQHLSLEQQLARPQQGPGAASVRRSQIYLPQPSGRTAVPDGAVGITTPERRGKAGGAGNPHGPTPGSVAAHPDSERNAFGGQRVAHHQSAPGSSLPVHLQPGSNRDTHPEGGPGSASPTRLPQSEHREHQCASESAAAAEPLLSQELDLC